MNEIVLVVIKSENVAHQYDVCALLLGFILL
jgi:hypothetical protein